MRAAGVHLKAGNLFIAVIEPALDGDPPKAVGERFRPSPNLQEAPKFTDLKDRVKQHLAQNSATAVSVVETRKGSQWSYKQVFPRVFGICAVLAASSELGLPCDTVTTLQISKSVGIPAANLETLPWTVPGYPEQPRYWSSGMAEAHACALHLLSANGRKS